MKINAKHSKTTGTNDSSPEINQTKDTDNNDSSEKNGMSCVYNSESPTGKTILITNYTHNASNCSLNFNNTTNKQKSHITIYTHKSDAENVSLPPSSINILINNHYDSEINEKSSNQAYFNETASKIKLEPFVDDDKKLLSKQNENNANANAKTDESSNETSSSSSSSSKFHVNEDIFVQRDNDQRLYLGTIQEFRDDLFHIKFDDDTMQWMKQIQLKKFNAIEEHRMCILCKNIDANQSIRICCQCQRAFHNKCLTDEHKTEENITNWCCSKCTTITNERFDLMEKSIVANPSKINKDKKFSYDIDALIWDTHHRQNIEQIYCYCGEKGKWFMQMLQCSRCLQWFHAKCVKCLIFPLYFGDR